MIDFHIGFWRRLSQSSDCLAIQIKFVRVSTKDCKAMYLDVIEAIYHWIDVKLNPYKQLALINIHMSEQQTPFPTSIGLCRQRQLDLMHNQVLIYDDQSLVAGGERNMNSCGSLLNHCNLWQFALRSIKALQVEKLKVMKGILQNSLLPA